MREILHALIIIKDFSVVFLNLEMVLFFNIDEKKN